MLNAQYGNRLAYYGNIQLARYLRPIQQYGAWPKEQIRLQPVSDPAYKAEDVKELIAPSIDKKIASNIAVIKRLKAELSASEDTEQRRLIRVNLDEARRDKERQFKLKARIDEEESAFILLH